MNRLKMYINYNFIGSLCWMITTLFTLQIFLFFFKFSFIVIVVVNPFFCRSDNTTQ
ncbi:hypothetical protein GLOIN_2v1583477 [Rhizophagus irregularis DAOM 181602=DAOM 197198]|uniref:Uncharacterized protein n=1 Tax=Rhizophagus irregularis (strain DAOM 181602 / DAOM 197198 / MUCL 43194) TaxID=747089 RepID=A0A2P4Q7K0_RHIID|nr:hypothetical protein GLOIN_2v1583477 [Rhizophagus irregularis DAOM 181602=DAOM 197198]POG73621.1 hypothetical protein GLOIN_2v1583477 [Rhizophagus irregularis DAOM 181602=DAOM 197198]|eukprot:XP_025180487.1 hypothetical protein GLOIN_2v1583477 [Rhizophagus irregularis DAOM 181602=DAOM 197198]